MSYMTCGNGPQPVKNLGISVLSLSELEKFKHHSYVDVLDIKHNCAVFFSDKCIRCLFLIENIISHWSPL